MTVKSIFFHKRQKEAVIILPGAFFALSFSLSSIIPIKTSFNALLTKTSAILSFAATALSSLWEAGPYFFRIHKH